MNANEYYKICNLFSLAHSDYGMPFRTIQQVMFISANNRHRITSNSWIGKNICEIIEKKLLDYILNSYF